MMRRYLTFSLNILPHPGYNKLANEIIDSKIKEKNSKKSDISALVAKAIATIATKAKLKAEQDEIVKL